MCHISQMGQECLGKKSEIRKLVKRYIGFIKVSMVR